MHIPDKYYLAEGKHRKVYIHPDNPDLCIKISKDQPRNRSRATKRELTYLNTYKERVTCFSFFHGVVESNLGQGYIFDLIRNEDGNISRQLSELTGLAGLEKKLTSLYQLFLNNGIIVGDLNAGSIVAREKKDGDYDLIIIDGTGNSDFIKICDYSKYFLRKKLIRKFNKLYRLLELPTSFT